MSYRFESCCVLCGACCVCVPVGLDRVLQHARTIKHVNHICIHTIRHHNATNLLVVRHLAHPHHHPHDPHRCRHRCRHCWSAFVVVARLQPVHQCICASLLVALQMIRHRHWDTEQYTSFQQDSSSQRHTHTHTHTQAHTHTVSVSSYQALITLPECAHVACILLHRRGLVHAI
jgi:hypothetical protein